MKVKLFFTKLQVLLPKKALIALLIFTLLLPATLPQTTSAQTPPSFSTPLNISNTSSQSNVPTVVIDKQGVVYVFWWDAPGGGVTELLYTTKPPGEPWSTPTSVVSTSGLRVHPSPAVDTDGTLHLLWYQDIPGTEVFYATKPPGGSWSTPVNVSNNGGDSGERAFSLATNGEGTLHAVWHDSTPGNYEILYSTKLPSGSWSIPINISNTPGESRRPQVGIDSSGTIHVVWADGSGIAYAKKSPSGSWGMPEFIPNSIGGDHATLAIDSFGTVHIMWGGIFYASKPLDGQWGTSPSI